MKHSLGSGSVVFFTSIDKLNIFVVPMTMLFGVYNFISQMLGYQLENKILVNKSYKYQGFQSGPVPGTFTRLRSCIVPAEITEPPKN